MIPQTFRGVIKGNTLVVLERAAPLPDGTPVEVSPLRHEAGSPDALLAAMAAAPQVSLEDIAELDDAVLSCFPRKLDSVCGGGNAECANER